MKHLIYILFLLMASSCSYNSIFIAKTNRFDRLEKIKKVVIVDPDYKFIDNREKSKKDFFKSYDMEQSFIKELKNSAKLVKLGIEVIDDNNLDKNSLDFFNYLLPLRNDIINTFFTYDVKYSEHQTKNGNNFYKPEFNIYEDNLEVDSKYSFLSEKYDTPYFSVCGVINIKKGVKFNVAKMLLLAPFELIDAYTRNNNSIYYNFVVNVESGNIVYRELREFEEPLSIPNLSAILYDHFKVLSKK